MKPSATTIRIRGKSHQVLKEMSAMTGKPLQELLEEAIEDRRRRLYLEGAVEDYASLRKDKKAWSDFQKEMHAWDSSNNDGLEKL